MTREEEEAEFRAKNRAALAMAFDAGRKSALVEAPRWRPHTVPVPQDDPERWVVMTRREDRPATIVMAKHAAVWIKVYRGRWCWWDDVDALLGGGA